MQSGSVAAPAGEAQATPPGQPNAAPQLPAPAAVAPQGQTVAVNIAKFAFVPATITISAGQSITWTNTDPVAHTSTSDNKVWDSGVLSPERDLQHDVLAAGHIRLSLHDSPLHPRHSRRQLTERGGRARATGSILRPAARCVGF